MTTQPHDPEGGALLWGIDGTLSVRQTPTGVRIQLIKGDVTTAIDAQSDDLEIFVAQLKAMVPFA